ncbi:MAG: AMP-binding protein [Alphaproteobacteria bacterium]|nr:AMP-binding protein [Alphaproteobacteria bacterium]
MSLPAFAVPGLCIPDVLSAHARWQPEALAVVGEGVRLTWRQFVADFHRLANALLARGLRKDDKVALLMRSSPEMLTAIAAIAKAGGVVVPLSPLFDPPAIGRMLVRSGSRFVIATAENRAALDRLRDTLPEVAEFIAADFAAAGWIDYPRLLAGQPDSEPRVSLRLDDDFNIMFTSGTTGEPKGTVHSHLSRLLYPLGWGLPIGLNQRPVTLLATPLYHNGTWISGLPTLHHGGTAVIVPKFEPRRFLELLAAERATHCFLVPTQLIGLLELDDLERHDTASWRAVLCGGSALPRTVFEAMRRRLPRVSFFEIYGMSEGFATFVGPDDYAAGKVGSVGKPLLAVNTDIRIVDAQGREAATGEVGEVVGTSALMMKGYYRDPKRTEEGLWRDPQGHAYLRSGDLGRLDADGYLYIVGRTKDMILSGGVNIYPIDIEEAFMQHPEVLEVACIGVPHERWGETPILLALMKPGAKVDAAGLLAWGNARLAKYQRVARVEFRASFPRNALDKILKRELREPYWRGRPSDIV